MSQNGPPKNWRAFSPPSRARVRGAGRVLMVVVLGPVVASRAVCRRRTGRPIGSLTWCRSGSPSRGPPVHHEIGAATLTASCISSLLVFACQLPLLLSVAIDVLRVWGFRGAPPGDPPVPHHEPGRSRGTPSSAGAPWHPPPGVESGERPPAEPHQIGQHAPRPHGQVKMLTTSGGPEAV